MDRGWETIFLLGILLVLMNACEEDAWPLEVVPKITLQEIAPTTVKQFEDSIRIVVAYEDGDGDIGFFNPDSLSLSVQDTRLENPDYYYVPPLTPHGDSLSIKGTLKVVIRNTFLLGNGGNETTRYEIRLKDRQGHWSNTALTPVITITE